MYASINVQQPLSMVPPRHLSDFSSLLVRRASLAHRSRLPLLLLLLVGTPTRSWLRTYRTNTGWTGPDRTHRASKRAAIWNCVYYNVHTYQQSILTQMGALIASAHAQSNLHGHAISAQEIVGHLKNAIKVGVPPYSCFGILGSSRLLYSSGRRSRSGLAWVSEPEGLSRCDVNGIAFLK